MYEDIKTYVVCAALIVQFLCLAGPLLVMAARRMRRQGLFFALIAAGFLVSMATKPPADTNRYAIAFHEGDAESAMAAQIVPFNQVTNLAPCTLTPPEGMRFLGWRSSIGSRLYDDGVLVFNLAPRTNRVFVLTAEWVLDE